MYAQLVYFDGPRSAEMIEAADRASRERIRPAVGSDPEVRDALVATFTLRQPDGSEVVLVVADTAEALARGNRLIAESPLQPGEDPALLPGPTRIENYEVIRAFGREFTPMGALS